MVITRDSLLIILIGLCIAFAITIVPKECFDRYMYTYFIIGMLINVYIDYVDSFKGRWSARLIVWPIMTLVWPILGTILVIPKEKR